MLYTETRCTGEYMLRDVSDSDDSFSPDEADNTSASARTPTIEPPGDQSDSLIAPPASSTITMDTKEVAKVESEDPEVPEDSGDPEMGPVYLKRLLPVFAELFHSSLAPPLRYVRTLLNGHKLCSVHPIATIL